MKFGIILFLLISSVNIFTQENIFDELLNNQWSVQSYADSRDKNLDSQLIFKFISETQTTLVQFTDIYGTELYDYNYYILYFYFY